jgi:molybdenum cofactor biosynthesis enzyme MoaA
VGRAGALCVSSQVGCTLNCTFCHTGTQALVRNLTAAEIVAQVQVARDDLGEWPSPKEDRRLTNVVFMGMGEPLYNLDHVAAAIDIMADGEGIAISRRRITVSTSGVAPELKGLGERTQAMLAISLHATNDPLRETLVPLNRKYPIAELMAAIRAYPGLSNAKRVTFEYVMLKGVNDSPAEAKALVQLLKGVPAKINLIPFNPWPGTTTSARLATIEAFAAILNRGGYASPIRTPRGPRHPGRLRPAEEREREAAGQRPPQGPPINRSPGEAGPRCSSEPTRKLGVQPALPAIRSRPVLSRRRSKGGLVMPIRSIAGDPGLRHRLSDHPAARGVTWLILFAARGLYILLTPHKEITLIREGNAAAAVSLAGCWWAGHPAGGVAEGLDQPDRDWRSGARPR